MTPSPFSIAGREVSRQAPPYVIAEMSGNHNHDIDRAKRLITAAAGAGAHAVKLQTYTADTITIQSTRPEFKVREGLWKGRSLYDLYQEAHTPWEWHGALFRHAHQVGVTIFSSVFDPTSVDFLMELHVPAFKIASAEITDWGLLEKVAGTGKPVVQSTGMASLTEIEEAVEILRSNGCTQLALLHCISAYPTPIDKSNLLRIQSLSERFETVVGLSDHTMGLVAGMAAVSLGASILEKHFTLRRADGGVDAAFSLEEHELRAYCEGVRDAHAALGNGDFGEVEIDAATRKFRRSLYFVKAIARGEIISVDHVRSIRPSDGLRPRHLKDLIGRRAIVDIEAGTPTDWSLVE